MTRRSVPLLRRTIRSHRDWMLGRFHGGVTDENEHANRSTDPGLRGLRHARGLAGAIDKRQHRRGPDRQLRPADEDSGRGARRSPRRQASRRNADRIVGGAADRRPLLPCPFGAREKKCCRPLPRRSRNREARWSWRRPQGAPRPKESTGDPCTRCDLQSSPKMGLTKARTNARAPMRTGNATTPSSSQSPVRSSGRKCGATRGPRRCRSEGSARRAGVTPPGPGRSCRLPADQPEQQDRERRVEQQVEDDRRRRSARPRSPCMTRWTRWSIPSSICLRDLLRPRQDDLHLHPDLHGQVHQRRGRPGDRQRARLRAALVEHPARR